jgi:amino acid adenylation domain-containing protein
VTIVHQRLLHDSLLAAAEREPDKVALVAGGERLTYGELLDRSLRLARALQDRGLQRGDRVAIFLSNGSPAVVAIFGTLLAGGSFIVVNPETKQDKLAYIVDDAEAAFLLTEGALARVFAPILPELASLEAVLCDAAPAELEGVDDLAQALADAEPAPAPAGTIPLDLAALIYTSGSTGQPKGVMMTHQSMVFAVGSISQYLRLGSDDRILGLLPLAFDYGLYQLLMSVRLGATLVLERTFAFPAQIVKRVEEEQITVFPGVPTVYATFLSILGRSPFELPSVRRVTNTAAALLPSMHEGLHRIFPNALVFAMYGLTECKRVCYLEPELLAERPDSVGKAIPGTETILLSPEGDEVAAGETGILHVRGPHVMAGYWRQPELTAHMLREGPVPGERMLCTHDWFRQDEDGFLYFVGRSDDIIKTRGEKVSPLEVEDVLVGIDGVKEAAVVGVDDDVLGQAIRAFVSLDDGVELGEREIVAACRLRLENFMVPRDVIVLDELPRTDTGKVRKKSLLEPAAAGTSA